MRPDQDAAFRGYINDDPEQALCHVCAEAGEPHNDDQHPDESAVYEGDFLDSPHVCRACAQAIDCELSADGLDALAEQLLQYAQGWKGEGMGGVLSHAWAEIRKLARLAREEAGE